MPFASPARSVLSWRTVATISCSLCLTLGVSGAPASADDDPIDRIHGNDRVHTAAAVAEAGWSQADHAILATSEDYPDAVAAAALAAELDAPLLLTPSDDLGTTTAAALDRLGTASVTILGGRGAVGGQVVDDLEEVGLDVERVAGPDRFATAASIAEEVAGPEGATVVALALGTHPSGGDAWPDALSAASLSRAGDGVPTLLTKNSGLPDATRDAIERLGAEHVVLLGGEASVSDAVVEELDELGLGVSRLHGPNRYATSVEVASRVIVGKSGVEAGRGQQDVPTPDRAVFVSGEDFADALSGGALATHMNVPIVLVPTGVLADEVDAFLRQDSTPVNEGIVIGGSAAVGGHVENELVAAILDQPRPEAPRSCPENSSPDCAYTYRHPVATWERLAHCESGGNWSINTGNGYYGGLQFNLSSWRGVGGAGYPHQNSKWEQMHRAEILQARQGWGAWPSCSRKLGLR